LNSLEIRHPRALEALQGQAFCGAGLDWAAGEHVSTNYTPIFGDRVFLLDEMHVAFEQIFLVLVLSCDA
jgi:hypothetical protein